MGIGESWGVNCDGLASCSGPTNILSCLLSLEPDMNPSHISNIFTVKFRNILFSRESIFSRTN